MHVEDSLVSLLCNLSLKQKIPGQKFHGQRSNCVYVVMPCKYVYTYVGYIGSRNFCGNIDQLNFKGYILYHWGLNDSYLNNLILETTHYMVYIYAHSGHIEIRGTLLSWCWASTTP